MENYVVYEVGYIVGAPCGDKYIFLMSDIEGVNFILILHLNQQQRHCMGYIIIVFGV